ncbi:hypothetical protein F2Q69_00060347 [Brassica cretica]|uniref:Uncharacterized protein n=1 Tax=Brassica cretica TaxID=69181 RepID=A0A8S9RE11_BRACR|nr:hypothetical protein F2Q69_00060347 [Brassica cretica]
MMTPDAYPRARLGGGGILLEDGPSAHSRVESQEKSPARVHVKKRTSAAHAKNRNLRRVAYTDCRL